MVVPADSDILRDRFKGFLTYLKPKLMMEGADLDKLSQLRRMSDVRIRCHAVGRASVTTADLCGLLSEPAVGRFDPMATQAGLILPPQLAAPLKPLSEEMGYVIEACLSLQLIGAERMKAHLGSWVAKAGPVSLPAAPAVKPAPPPPWASTIPEPVAKILGHVKDLWAIPANTDKIQKLLANPNTLVEAVSADIERDPALSAQCLRVVNSAYYATAEKISSVKRAIVTLGFQTTRRIITISGLMQQLGKKRQDVTLDLNAFWGHSLWVAHAASLASRASKYGQPEDFFSAGLIHDIGKLVIYQYLPAPFRLLQAAVKAGETWEAAERRLLGVNHAVIGASVCERWGFPPAVSEAVRHHLDPLETLEDLELPRESIVAAAMCTVSKKTLSKDETGTWAKILRVSSLQLSEIRQQASTLALGSLKDVFVLS